MSNKPREYKVKILDPTWGMMDIRLNGGIWITNDSSFRQHFGHVHRSYIYPHNVDYFHYCVQTYVTT
jgi:hypothetical protein